MTRHSVTIRTLVALLLMAASCAWAKDQTPDEKRADIRKDAEATLKRLYKAEPHAKGAISGAAGYAVFDNMGVNLLLLSTARGSGMAADNKTKKISYMKMLSGGVGFGAGIKDYCVIFLFENQQALARFIDSGWDASTQADAAAKSASKGDAFSGAASVAPGVWVYQLTKKGLALQVTLQGTKYFKNSELN